MYLYFIRWRAQLLDFVVNLIFFNLVPTQNPTFVLGSVYSALIHTSLAYYKLYELHAVYPLLDMPML